MVTMDGDVSLVQPERSDRELRPAQIKASYSSRAAAAMSGVRNRSSTVNTRNCRSTQNQLQWVAARSLEHCFEAGSHAAQTGWP